MPAFDRDSRIGFIGAGAVGGSLAVALSRKAYRVVAVASRSLSSAESVAGRVAGCEPRETGQEVVDAADVVFLTTPDDAIRPVASSVSWRPGQAAVHCSGAGSLDVLDPVAEQRAARGAFHPLQQFSDIDNGSKSFPGITFGIEADRQLRGFLEEAARSIGGHPVFLRPEDKPLYHITGVMMGNLLSTFVASAAGVWDAFGMTRAQGLGALLPMMRQVAANLESMGLPNAVSGPYVRGDIGTVRKHLAALEVGAPDVLPLYRELALLSLPLAVEKGALPQERSEEIRAILEESKAGGDSLSSTEDTVPEE
jgi:predicted short-subunit dehydrogenase-like oxidoreductase (DUF2520 family)